MIPQHHPFPRQPLRRALALVFALAGFALPGGAEESRHFNVPAGEAARSLKLFSEQSGRGVIVGAATIEGIRTNAATGQLTAREALARMLERTSLVAREDANTGAFAISRAAPESSPTPKAEAARGEARPRTRVVDPDPAATDGDTIVLNPFDVTAGPTRGYMATNTISGTAMNTPLKDVPMTINVITAELLADMAITDLAQAFTFNSSITQTNRQPVGNRADAWSIRGFRNRNVLLDGVTGGDFIPPQMIDRIEVVKGPNTLYGQSDPGGLINIITKRPQGRDRLGVALRAGNHGLLGADFDGNTKSFDGRLGVRVFGAHTESDGYRVVDGRTTDFLGLATDFRLTKNTTLVLHGSASRTEGVPSQRSTFSFEIVPTDLNGDGVIDNTNVNGVTERSARFNNTFLPRNYTSATERTRFTQQNRFGQLGLRHTFNPHLNVQYLFVRTTQELDLSLREYNTFNAAGSSDALHSADLDFNRTEAHTINGLLTFATGSLAHRILVGGRYTADLDQSSSYRLRALGPSAERTILEGMIARGRSIRLFLTKDDVLRGVKYWLDDVPSPEELRTLGTRLSAVDFGETRVGSIYVTDSVSLLENRLKILGGVRYIRIRGQSTNIAGQKIGVPNDQSRTSYQAGGVFDLTQRTAVFASTATAFNPNGFDSLNGVFFAPELSRAYEAGLKFDDLWSGRLSGSLAVFNIRKENVRRSDYNPVTFRSDNEITDDESQGWEAELYFNPVKNWQTVLNYSRIDAKVIVSRTLAKNLRLEGAAPHRLTFWNSYGFTGGPLKGLRLGGGVIVAQGPIQQFGTSSNRLIVENGYTVINLFARYSTRIFERTLTLGANIDNLNDVFFIRARAATNDPRQIAFSASLDL